MAVIADLERVTNHLLVLLEKALPNEDRRDAFIEEIDKMLQIRESLLQRLSLPFSEEEMQMGRKIAKASELIPKRLEIYQKQMKQEYSSIQQSKRTVRAYEQAYAGVSIDGMYYDKRN